MLTNVPKNLLYCDKFPLWIHYFLTFLCVHNSNIWHTWLGCVPSLHGCGWPLCLGLCFLNLLNCLHHWLLQLFFFLPVNNIFCFSWLSILEHLLFSYFTSCGNINIHHIHIHNDSLCFNNKLNLYYCHRFPMKHFLHLNKLLTIYHFMSIQTIDVTCIWKCFSCFFDLVMQPMWLPSWSTFFFCMSPHCDLSSHNLCNVC